MPSFCVVLDCDQKYAHTDDVSFHKFPKEEELLNEWKIFTGRNESWEPSRWSAICSRHFKESDFRKCATRKILKRNAVPTILICRNGISRTILTNEDQIKHLSDNVRVIDNSEILENRKTDNDLKESKILSLHHIEENNAKLVPLSTLKNSNLNTFSEIFSIPLELPLCVESHNIETVPVSACNTSQQESHNEIQQYDMNLNGTSNFANFYDSSTAPCRLCGQEDHITNSFLNDFEIFGMIQKCMPTLNIRQDDTFSKEVCSNCLEQLENFNAFVDQVISHQKNLLENIEPIEQEYAGEQRAVISSVKVKQEPVSNMKMNIKQEILDTHYPSHTEDNINNQVDHNIAEPNHFPESEENFPIEEEAEEQKFSYRESSSLNTREIVKNCDIIEIINLEDGYIDIPDDEIDDCHSNLEQNSHPKVIDNKEIKVQKKVIEDIERFSKGSIIPPSLVQYVIEEHNYTKNHGDQLEQFLNDNGYKQEQLEDEKADNEMIILKDESNIKKTDLNCVIQKIEITNSPKKIVPKKEMLTFVAKESENVSNENQLDDDNLSPILYDLLDGLIFPEENLSNSNIIRPKISNKSNIVVINESILKPGGDIQPFELRKCPECSLQFFSIDSFNEHQKMHNSSLPLQQIKTSEAICTHFCVLCESNFDSFYELLKHRSKCRVKNQLSTTNPKKILKNVWKCPMCFKIFKSKLALNNHRKYICKYPLNGNRFSCKYCGDYFKKWILCRRHEKLCRIQRMRRTTEKKGNVVELEKENCIKLEEQQSKKIENLILNSNEQKTLLNRFNCEQCNRSYTRYQNLLRHKKVHRPKDEWNYKCGSCDKRFDRMYDLKLHLKSAECPCVPSKPDTIFFVCQTCGKKFKTLQILKEHGVTHSDQLPYVCEICNKSFKALRNLRQHKITHSNVKTIQCDLCDKTFKRLNGLLQHKRGFHLKIKPHICEVCKHAYSLKGDMLRCKHKYLSV